MKIMNLPDAVGLLRNQSAVAAFSVWRDGNPTGDQTTHMVFYFSQSNSGASWLALFSRFSNVLRAGGRRIVGDTQVFASTNQTSNRVMSGVYADFSGGALRYAQNGSAYISTAYSSGAGLSQDIDSAVVQLFTFNSIAANRMPLNSYISEIVLKQGAVTVDEKAKIEGYLAHKWGLAGNLPAGHPYKSAPPTK